MAWDRINFKFGEDSDSCIWTCMTGLSGFHGPTSGFDVMVEFSKKHLSNTGTGWSNPSLMYSHYVFSGPCGTQGYTSYAQRFAEYLKQEKLGEVIHGEPVENKKYHPGRKGQVFIWIPDQKACTAWWKLNNPETKAKAAAETVIAAEHKPRKPRVPKVAQA